MGNHFIMPLLCSFDISLTAHSLIHKDEIRVGLFFSGACSLSSLLSWIINLCQSLFCSLQVTRSPFEISLLGTVSLLILSLCLHLVHLHLTHSYFFPPPPPHLYSDLSFIFALLCLYSWKPALAVSPGAHRESILIPFAFTPCSFSCLFISVKAAELQIQSVPIISPLLNRLRLCLLPCSLARKDFLIPF